jgi:hypothetical protein
MGSEAEIGVMKNEVRFLNLLCVIAAAGFVVLAILNAILSGEFLTTDNLFVTLVCLVMSLMFAINPLLYLKSEGRLPLPFLKRASPNSTELAASSPPPLLDSKGRPVPPDVRALVAQMGQSRPKDV